MIPVDARDTDLSKELAELLHQSKTDKKPIAEGYNNEEKVLTEGHDNKDADALAKIMMDEIMKSESDDDLLASLMAVDSNEKEAVARLQWWFRRYLHRFRRFFKHRRRFGK